MNKKRIILLSLTMCVLLISCKKDNTLDKEEKVTVTPNEVVSKEQEQASTEEIDNDSVDESHNEIEDIDPGYVTIDSMIETYNKIAEDNLKVKTKNNDISLIDINSILDIAVDYSEIQLHNGDVVVIVSLKDYKDKKTLEVIENTINANELKKSIYCGYLLIISSDEYTSILSNLEYCIDGYAFAIIDEISNTNN